MYQRLTEYGRSIRRLFGYRRSIYVDRIYEYMNVCRPNREGEREGERERERAGGGGEV